MNTNTNYNDDEMTSASKIMDDFDEIHDLVEDFEQMAHSSKKRLNKMEKIN